MTEPKPLVYKYGLLLSERDFADLGEALARIDDAEQRAWLGLLLRDVDDE